MHRPIRFWILRGFVVILAIVALLLLALLGMALWPLSNEELVLNTTPISEYTVAREAIADMREDAPEGIRPECRGSILDHGRRTEEVYVLMHGLTNCPAQFIQFAQLLFDDGANVLIPRTPYHGFMEEYADDQQLLTGQDILDAANQAIDAAHAYGDRVTVIGLSVNGATCAWLAQNRADIDRLVAIAPFLAPYGIDAKWIEPIGRLVYRLPNSLIWWDRQLKDQLERPSYAYPKFATHPIAHVMRIGLDAFDSAEEKPPVAKKILMVTSASDTAINNDRVDELTALWKTSAPDRVTSYEFPAEQKVPHDSIDPNQPNQQIAIVYPKLIELMEAM